LPAKKIGDKVAHYNFHGGQHDLLVPEEAATLQTLSEKSECPECFYTLSTLDMKNTYHTISHNWLWFDWLFLNQLVPFISR